MPTNCRVYAIAWWRSCATDPTCRRSACLATYLGTAAAVPVLRRHPASPGTGFRLPGGPLIPIAAGALTLGLAASATTANLVAAAIAVAVGVLIFVARRR